MTARIGIRSVRRSFRRLAIPLIVLVALATIGALPGCEATSIPGTSEASDESRASAIHTITAEEAHGMLVSDRDVILDVRTQEEYQASHICNARLLPLDDITEETALEIAPDKDAPVFVYCRTGIRSAQAAEALEECGYTDIYDFGGILSWTYGTIDAADEGCEGTKENDQLPVGVKVVCGQTRALPDDDEAK